MHTLVYRIDVQYEINVQVGKFLKNIKRAGQNRRAGGICFSEISINVQVETNVQGDFIFKILKKVQDFVHNLVLLIDINLSNVMKYYLKIDKHADQNKAV